MKGECTKSVCTKNNCTKSPSEPQLYEKLYCQFQNFYTLFIDQLTLLPPPQYRAEKNFFQIWGGGATLVSFCKM
jgi:hypothetical protein